MKINIKDIFEKDGRPEAHTNSRLDVDEVFAEALSADGNEADEDQAATEPEVKKSVPMEETEEAVNTEPEKMEAVFETHSLKGDEGPERESAPVTESQQESAPKISDKIEPDEGIEAAQEVSGIVERSEADETKPEASDPGEDSEESGAEPGNANGDETDAAESRAEADEAVPEKDEPAAEAVPEKDEPDEAVPENDEQADEAIDEGPELSGEEDDPKEAAAESPKAEKREARRFALSKEYGWPAGITAAFIGIILLVIVYTTMIPREVNATINGEEFEFSSRSHTVEGFLEEENISFCKDDYISMPLETFIYDGIEIEINHATDFTVTADGKTKKYKSLENTVGDALKDVNVKVGEKDIVDPAMDSLLAKNMKIVIQRVEVKSEVVEEEVPFKTVTKDDSSLDEGKTKVVTEGVKGKDKVTYEVTYIDGKESSRKEVARETVTAAVDKVVANGTRISFNGQSYSRKLVVKAYAYTGGGRTAMGTRARVGEIAVDPSVIPLGSNVYIEGVGARRAEDTGGNIKGNTIDIYMDTQSQCINWGARYVTIYIQ